MKTLHHGKKIVDELCTYLGQDLDNPMCRELQRHMEECPECKEYMESIKLTVKVFRENYKSKSVPKKVTENLMLKLNLKSSR